MSTAATPLVRRAGPRTRVAAVLVLIGLAALASFALFSGPTTIPLPASPKQAAPARTAPLHQDEQPAGRGD
jgi:hypothetical protein